MPRPSRAYPTISLSEFLAEPQPNAYGSVVTRWERLVREVAELVTFAQTMPESPERDAFLAKARALQVDVWDGLPNGEA